MPSTSGIAGLRYTDNFVADERPKNWREGILHLFPNGKAPLFAMTSLMKSQSTDDPEFNWWEKVMPSQRVAQTADLDKSETDLTFAANAAKNAGWQDDDIILSEGSRELMRVTDVDKSTTLVTVTRGWGPSSGTALDISEINPNFVVIGKVIEENSTAPGGINFDPTKRTNYTQIFRNTIEMSRTAQKTRLRTGDQVREAKRECLELHSMQIEKAIWFGQGQEASEGSSIARQTHGIDYWMRTYASGNVWAGTDWDADYTMAWDELEADILEPAFRYGSTEKVGFCGNKFLLVLQKCIRMATGSTINIMQGQKEYGMDVSRLVCPFGTLVLKTHPLFNQLTTPATTDPTSAANSCYILDMANFRYRYLRDSDTQFQGKLQTNDLDGLKSGYLTECGLEIHHPETHFLVQGANLASGE